MRKSTFVKKWPWLAMISGLGAIFSYVVPTQMPLGGMINPILFVFFGVFLILFAVSLFHLIDKDSSRLSTIIGTQLLIIAGCTHTIMAAMQASLRAELITLRTIFGTENPELLNVLVSGLSSIQLGVDFAFDLFVTTGVIFCSTALWQHARSGKLICMAGILIAITGFSFNLIAFPDNPGTYGLMDPGALFGAWFTTVWLWIGFVYLNNEPKGKNASVHPGI